MARVSATMRSLKFPVREIIAFHIDVDWLEEIRIGEGNGEYSFALVREVQLEYLPQLKRVTVRGKSFWCTPMLYVTSG